jgi:VWFA-related protein
LVFPLWPCASVATVVSLFSMASAQTPTFRSATDLVQVDVVVRDGRGEFVRGLTSADFDIREDGKPQQIDFVELVDVSGRPAAAAPAGAAAAPVASPARVFVLVFDEAHLTPGPFRRLQQAAIEFLERYFQANDIGGVVIGGRMAGNRMTTNREELIEAVRRAKSPGELNSMRIEMRRWPRILNEHEALRIMSGDRTVYEVVERRACAEEPDECGGNRDPEAQIRIKVAQIAGRARAMTQQTLAMLDTIGNGLRRFQGRKNVVLLSEGFVADEFMTRLTELTGTAARAGAAFYVLDARGLDRSSSTNSFVAQNPTGSDGIASALAAIDSSGDAPNLLATATGGMVIRNMNDFSGALKIINEDAGTYYVLAYRPANASLDGKFRKIDVSVKRPGVEVRARRGYVAAPDLPALLTRPAGLSPSTAGSPQNEASRPGPADAPAADSPNPSPVPAAASPNDAPAVMAGAATRLRPGAVENVATLAANPSKASERVAAVDDLARAGWERYQKGDVEGARVSLSAATERGSARPWVHYALGMSEFALSRYRDAAAAWEQVRAAVPEFQPAYVDLADAYLQVGDLQKSLDVLRQARLRWPRNGEILNALGVIYVRRALLDPAIEVFEAAMNSEPNEALAYFNAARAYEMRYVKSRRYSDAKKEWAAHDPDRRQAIALYARYLKMGGPFERSARESLERLEWAGR